MKLLLHSCTNDYTASLSLCTVLHSRELLGRTYRGFAYRQLIRDINKQKRLMWALQKQNDNFENVMFSDEASIQIETIDCGATVKRRNSQDQVHVWVGISKQGATGMYCHFH